MHFKHEHSETILLLTCQRLISLVFVREFPDLDEVVEDWPDLFLVRDEFVLEDHLGHVVVEAADLEGSSVA